MTQPHGTQDLNGSRVSDERLAEMLAGLEGVTPGPYELVIHPSDEPQEDDIILWSTSQDANIGRLFPFMRAHGAMPHRLNAEHFMRCDPDTMRAILTELQSRRSEPSEPVAWQAILQRAIEGNPTIESPEDHVEYLIGCIRSALYASPLAAGEAK